MYRRAAPSLTLLALSLALLSCASGGASTSTSTRGARPRVVLVEVEGSGNEVEAFVDGLSVEAADSRRIQLTDARLAGARLADLAADPGGDRARAFREMYPADALLSVRVSPCQSRASTASVPTTDPSTGLRTMQVLVSYRAECSASFSLVAAADGHSLGGESITGAGAIRAESPGDEAAPESEAAHDAARRLSKRIAALLAR